MRRILGQLVKGLANNTQLKTNTRLNLSTTVNRLQVHRQWSFAKKGKKDSKKDNKKDSKKDNNEEGDVTIDLNIIEQKMKNNVKEFKEELNKMKLGRLGTDMLKDMKVKAYGEQVNLLDLCQSMNKGADTLVLNVFDSSLIKDVVSCLNNSNLEFKIQKEGSNIILQMMDTNTVESKQMLVQQCKGVLDLYKNKIRANRSEGVDYVNAFKERVEKNSIFRMNKEVQEIHDDVQKELQDLMKQKESELMAGGQDVKQTGKKKKK